ncbi:MAG: 6-bladed beta-propeller [bacterium]|nr:6-bladed beta-propeller [bacterium]
MFRLNKSILVPIITVIFFLNCSSDNKPDVTTVQEVKIIHNKEPLYSEPQIKLEFIRKYGGIEPGDDEYILHRPRDVAVDSDGYLYIADQSEYDIKKFDTNGKFVSKFGRQGRGPNEFHYPHDIQIDVHGNFYIQNTGGLGLKMFNKQWQYITSFKEHFVGHPVEYKLIDEERMLLSYPNKIDPEYFLFITGREGIILNKFGEVRQYEHIFMKNNGYSAYINIDKYKNIYTSFSYQNRIEKYTPDGQLLMKISRDLPYKESLNYYTRNIIDENGKFVQSRWDANRFSNGIEIDHQNRIWVPTLFRQKLNKEFLDKVNDADNRMLEVYSEEGILLERIKHEKVRYMSEIRIFDDKLFIINGDYECAVYEYRIIN